MTVMQAWELQGEGLANLRRVDRPTPTPGPGELLVRVRAVALNYRDKAIVDGAHRPGGLAGPLIPVSDAVGVVEGVGPGVARFEVGARVTTHLFSRWVDGMPGPEQGDHHCFGGPLPGGLAEFMIIPEGAAVAPPAGLTDAEAATLPTAALTAWFALVDRGGLAAGQAVLVQGTGGVALFAVQIAAAIGARVIVTSGSDAKLDRARALGATDGINYARDPEWQAIARALTGDVGVDHVLDLVGGSGLNRSIAAARIGGQVTVIGFLGGQRAEVDLLPLMFRKTLIRGSSVGHRAAFEAMNRFLAEHAIRPVIDSVYPFDDAIPAFEHLARGPFGKVVIRIGPDAQVS